MKQSKKISQQEKAIENLNVFEKKLTITEHPKTSHKLFKIIKHTEKVSHIDGAGNSIYSKTKHAKTFWMEKKSKHNQTITCLDRLSQ